MSLSEISKKKTERRGWLKKGSGGSGKNSSRGDRKKGRKKMDRRTLRVQTNWSVLF